ncbi:GntR family transcriptional regulator [Microbacterium sp. JZ31]|uniref:GntR family transcriptional regulator n=1 Tax=Microbacterium sp. JZ31 TaxID=1906274 RepID=UPI00193129E0|nr:GntR family transcriptional regulator [Microbacterium sp. JZ31]
MAERADDRAGRADVSRSAAASVYERIRTMILASEIAPGEKLNIDQLARQLGVSQTPVREAVQRLEGDQLVVARRPRGYATTQLLDEAGLRHMFEVRLLLEPWSARAAAVDRAANPGAAMLREIDRFAAEMHGDPRHLMSAHDTRFHELILRAVGNDFLANAFRQMHPHLHLFRLYPADIDGAHTIAEHERIARAIAAADPDEAEQAMRAHLLAAMERFSAGVDGGAPSLAGVRPGAVRPRTADVG